MIALIFALVVFSFVFSLTRYFLRRKRMRARGLPAKAVVTNVSLDTRVRVSRNTTEYIMTPRRQYCHQLSYWVNGYAYTGSYVSYIARNVGDVIDIFCNPENPNDMMLAQSPGADPKKGLSVIIVLAAFIIIIVVFTVVALAFARFGR